VYAKRPFAGPERLLGYLARYTHRIAISNGRLISFDDDQVRFGYRDRRRGDKARAMTLSRDEFLRRFLLHVLPSGFMRIRHFGLFANRTRARKLALARAALGQPPPPSCDRSNRPRSSCSESLASISFAARTVEKAGCKLSRSPRLPGESRTTRRGRHRDLRQSQNRSFHSPSMPLGRSPSRSSHPVSRKPRP